MKTAISREELAETIGRWKAAGDSIAFVPTMGALHQGHLELITHAKSIASRVVVSIFVNPAQFGPTEDFAAYPRTVERDSALLRAKGLDLLFLPDVSSIYPEGFQTTVNNKELSTILCGKVRPGHFEGVLTVVHVLLRLVQPNLLVMGKKDFQQIYLVDRMVQDLALNVRVVPVETVRELDGLAMSSRNRYLTPAEREVAPKIFEGLSAAKAAFLLGENRPHKIIEAFCKAIDSSEQLRLEYCEIRRIRNLGEFSDHVDSDAVVLAAVRLGTARLIDNIELRRGDSN